MAIVDVYFFILATHNGFRFCTGRLYGTYSERRSTLTVTVSRWTFAFLLLHNLCAAGSFAATVCARTLTEGWEEAADAHRMLDEVALLLIVLCVPASYLVGAMGQRCCGARSEAELEMEKMDKIYQEVRIFSVHLFIFSVLLVCF